MQWHTQETHIIDIVAPMRNNTILIMASSQFSKLCFTFGQVMMDLNDQEIEREIACHDPKTGHVTSIIRRDTNYRE